MNTSSLKAFFLRHWIVIALFFCAIAVRWSHLENNTLMFWFDQARDASVSRDIIEKGDLKIQGPSASGTKDAVYHGVLYYYIIAPIYTVTEGDPIAVARYLAIIGSLSIFITYALGIRIFKSKTVGLFAAFFTSVSFLHTQESVWLSNPQLLTIGIPLFYLFFWNIFFDKPRQRDFIFLGLVSAFCIQSAIFEIFLLFTIMLAYIFRSTQERKLVLFKWKDIASFVGATVFGLSTMIITELLMIKRGILSFEAVSTFETMKVDSIEVITKTLDLYAIFFRDALSPHSSALFFILLLITFCYGLNQAKRSVQQWAIIYLTGPLWLLTWHYRDSTHIFIGFDILVYLFTALSLVKIKNDIFLGKLFTGLVLIVFLIVNFGATKVFDEERNHYFAIQKRALLSEQLSLIDKTYEIAAGQPFTFSATTNPYGINITWSYLYDWYGNKKYGYKPQFYGPSQTGYVGGNLLEEVDDPAPIHFTILEPDTGLPTLLHEQFISNQDSRTGTPSATIKFGSLGLDVR